MKIARITVGTKYDTEMDLSYLGTFSDQWEEGAVPTGLGSNYHQWFIPQNKEYGKEDYDLYCQYLDGDRFTVKAFAEAELEEIDLPVQVIRSGIIGGLESEDEDGIRRAVEDCMKELSEVLESLRFTPEEIGSAPMIADYYGGQQH